jgi:hypothetical protein
MIRETERDVEVAMEIGDDAAAEPRAANLLLPDVTVADVGFAICVLINPRRTLAPDETTFPQLSFNDGCNTLPVTDTAPTGTYAYQNKLEPEP